MQLVIKSIFKMLYLKYIILTIRLTLKNRLIHITMLSLRWKHPKAFAIMIYTFQEANIKNHEHKTTAYIKHNIIKQL